MTEHVVLYPGVTLGPASIPSSFPIADPLECLSFVAAATSTILLGTAVLLVPYHHPVVLAKRVATVDVLSKGRMRLLTVGVGALPGEAAAVGVDYTTRGRFPAAPSPRGCGRPARAHAGHRAGRGPGCGRPGVHPLGSIDLTGPDVDALAADGVTRLVVAPASPDPAEQRDQLSAFADRHIDEGAPRADRLSWLRV